MRDNFLLLELCEECQLNEHVHAYESEMQKRESWQHCRAGCIPGDDGGTRKHFTMHKLFNEPKCRAET